VTAASKRRRKTAIGAALLAPLVLLGARRALRAAALRNEARRAPLASPRAATVGPAAAAVSAAPTVVPLEADRSKRKRRTRRFALAAASVALVAVFIQHAQSRVPRPTLIVDRPANVSPATQPRLHSDEIPKSPAPVTHSDTRGEAPASTPRASTRSRARASRHALRHQYLKRQSHGALPSRRPTKPAVPAKPARERPVSSVHAVAGRASRGLRWNAVAGATYYNLILWRDGTRILDLWPTTPRAVVPTTSVNHGPRSRLSPGRYLWFVYPGFGPKPARHYGALAGSGVLVVQPKGGNEG
jgi:hypothetical protein